MSAQQIIFLATLVVLQYADIWTTYRVLSRGGRELNPVIRWLINRFGLLQGLLTYKAPMVVLVILATALGYMPAWLLGALCLLYVVVVTSNLRQMLKQ